jgi:ABC-type glutathione transport system ATPase component
MADAKVSPSIVLEIKTQSTTPTTDHQAVITQVSGRNQTSVGKVKPISIYAKDLIVFRNNNTVKTFKTTPIFNKKNPANSHNSSSGSRSDSRTRSRSNGSHSHSSENNDTYFNNNITSSPENTSPKKTSPIDISPPPQLILPPPAPPPANTVNTTQQVENKNYVNSNSSTTVLLNNISLYIQSGTLTGIIGSSGSGEKTCCSFTSPTIYL